MNLEQRLRAALTVPADLPIAGDDIDPPFTEAAPAAVLAAITDQADPGLILTVRRDDMRTHAGQVAFPGGRIDPGESAIEAALREAHEELLLDPASVRVIGTLDPYRTVTGFSVTAVIGLVPPEPPLIPHEHEVADWFEMPLGFALDPANRASRSTLFAGRERHYYEILWNDRRIWGATAAMIVNLSNRLRWL